jgi:hypothetical protein
MIGRAVTAGWNRSHLQPRVLLSGTVLLFLLMVYPLNFQAWRFVLGLSTLLERSSSSELATV